ncbi:HNH endonuclease signature motif containing protein [Demequina globuliformis]|uniref:HNH endonuclease signature motif containing protein n=1 Tax=Demequina globuliformis TaxID=676202 RepID=UPI000785526D|nr:HNH endonuclease signature motif containing protein [Demequina globuliformis]
MQISTAELERSVAAVAAYDGTDLATRAPDDVVAVQRVLADVRRQADALLVQVAGELARLSEPSEGNKGIARQKGFHGPGGLIANTLGGSDGEAKRLLVAARGTQASPGGDAPRFPTLARAIRSGALSPDKAALLTEALERVAEDSPGAVVEFEERMVTKARHQSLREVRRMIQLHEAHRRPQDIEARDRRAHRERSVTHRELPDGTVEIFAKLDVVSAAPVLAVMDAHVKHVFQQRRDRESLPVAERVGPADDRRAPQIRADFLVALCRHAVDCDETPTGVKTTVVVRMDAGDLRTELERTAAPAEDAASERSGGTFGGGGIGEVDGIAMPVSAAALRQMAVDAEVLPVLLGGEALPLDVGRARRLFSRAQKIALLERDGGCAWCHAPPSYCDAHHIRWWDRDRGPTDISNGVMLCVRCHHRVHSDGWEIRVRDGEVWFRPPASVDRERRPRIGGRAHLEVHT